MSSLVILAASVFKISCRQKTDRQMPVKTSPLHLQSVWVTSHRNTQRDVQTDITSHRDRQTDTAGNQDKQTDRQAQQVTETDRQTQQVIKTNRHTDRQTDITSH